MAVVLPSTINGVPYSAEVMRRNMGVAFAQSAPGVVRSGVIGAAPSVSLSGSTVQVGPFSAVIGSAKGAYLSGLDSITSAGTLGVANTTNGRLDRVVLEVLDPDNGGVAGVREGRLRVITGTAAALPGLPALPANALHLAQIMVPRSGAGNPVVTVDVQFTTTVGSPVPVRSQAERDDLPKSVGLSVARLDASGAIETWDGGNWSGATTPSATSAGWVFTGMVSREATAVGPIVTAGFRAGYTGGSFSVTTTYVRAFTLTNSATFPVSDVYGFCTLRVGGGARAVKGDCSFVIDPAGSVYVRTLFGQAATNVAAGDEIYFSASWVAK